MKGNPLDPKGLIYESYRIDGITPEECRSIFLERNTSATIKGLLAQYHDDQPGHPMTQVLKEGLTTMAAPRRRGGWRSRPRN